MKGFISRLKDCRVKYKDPSEKMNDKQFILVDDDGTLDTPHVLRHMHVYMYTHVILKVMYKSCVIYSHNKYSDEFPNVFIS